MSSNKFLFTILGLLLLTSVSYAQNHRCATPAEKSEFLIDYQKHPEKYSKFSRSNDPLILPLTIHTVGTSAGENHVSKFSVMDMICQLNQDFAPHNISFFLNGEIRKINSDTYNEHPSSAIGGQMIRTYKDPKSLNVFLVESGPESVVGYYSPSSDGIVQINTSAQISNHTITHEMGHMLGLPHTFFGWESSEYHSCDIAPRHLGIRGRDTLYVERVDGQNCDKAGDGFCDTPPDYLNYIWGCDNTLNSRDCQKDPSGVEFRSDGTLYMSYSANNCQNRFSAEQVAAMKAQIQSRRSDIIRSPLESLQAVNDENLNLTFPLEGQDVRFDNFQLEWDFVPNATHYIVEVSKFSFFPVNDVQLITTDNFVNITGLELGRKYYWRIKPYSAFDFCTNYSDAKSFQTALETSLTKFEEGTTINVYPTILSAGNVTAEVNFVNPESLDVELIQVNGNRVWQTHLSSGLDHLVNIPATDLPSGMYILRMHNGAGESAHKILIQ